MGLTQEQWLSFATEFSFGQCAIYHRDVKIELRTQRDDSKLWVVKMDSWCLGKDKKWHYEMSPSNRTDKFINKTRFNTPEEAYNFWRKNVKNKQILFY